MKIVQSLSVLSLRPLLGTAGAVAAPDGTPAADFWKRRLAEQGQRSATVLERTSDRAWKALEVALAGVPWWNRCRVLLEPGEDLALGDPVEAYLSSVTLPDGEEAERLQCLADLRAARRAELLSGANELETVADLAVNGQVPDDGSAMGAIAGALREAGFTSLANFMGQRTGDTPFLASAARWFLRHAIEADPDLSTGAPSLESVIPEPAVRFLALAEVLDRHEARLELLLGTLPTGQAAPAGYPLDIDRELDGQKETAKRFAAEVREMLADRGMLRRGLRLTDANTIRDEATRQRIAELRVIFHGLDADKQAMPAVLNGLAMLEAAAGDYEAAQADLQTAAAAVTEPHALAVIQFNSYRVALEQRDWAEALTLLERATTLWPDHFALLPLEKFEPQRILGVAAAGITFLCRDRLADDRVVVKSLAPHTLQADVAEIFRVAGVLQEIDHPVLLAPRDTDFAASDQSRPYIVTDYFEGLTLGEQVQQHGPLSPEDLLQIARPLAEGLRSAHERGLLHLDLKPDNVLLRLEDGKWLTKVIDFALTLKPAALYGSLAGGRSSVHVAALATLSYAAPEASGWALGVPVGPTSDVYSFGRTCYYALLGTPEPDDEEKESLPTGWRKLLAACTARTIARRIPNFQIVLDRLGSLMKAPPAVESADKKPATAGTPRGEAEKALGYLERGMIFRQQGNHDQALAAFNKALEIDPNQTAGFIKRGNLFADRGHLDRAVADYSAAIKVDPKFALAYLNRGLAFAKRGEFDKVIADTSKALELDPKLGSAYFIRGAAYANRGDKHRAIAEFGQAIRLDPKNPLAHNDRGLAFADQGEYDRAIADYTAALRLDPKLTLAYINRGIAFRLKGNLERAVAEFTKALRLEPRSLQAYFNRGLAYLDAKDFDKAALDFERVLRLDPKHTEAAARRDEAQKARKGGTAAMARHNAPARPRREEEKRPAVSTAPQRTAPEERRPSTRPAGDEKRPLPRPGGEEKRPAGTARPTSEEKRPTTPTAKSTPEDERRQVRAAAYFARGRTLYEQGEYDQAIEQFTKAIQIDPKDAQAHYQRGLSFVAQNEYEDAIVDYNNALQLNPKFHLAYYHRGIAHQLLGQHDKAIADYTRTLKLEPRMAVAYRHRGQALQAKGDSARAQADFEEAARLDPNLGKR